MVFAEHFGSGQVLWSLFWFFLFFMWIWLVISIFADVLRSRDLSGWAKALWAIVIVFAPFVGVFAYLIVRGGKMAEHSVDDARQQEQAVQSYIRGAAGVSGSADELAKLAELHANGTLDDAEFAQAKARVLAA